MSDHIENIITLLFIGSNFKNTKVVRTEKEFEIIRKVLKTTYFGKLINFKYKFAVKRDYLEQIIGEIKPQVIHFSGHGIHNVGPLFEGDGDEFENSSIDMTENLTNILYNFRDHIELVLFNVCESINIARRVASFINFTVGARGKTDDDSAIAFAKGFYENLLNHDNLRKSVERGNDRYNFELSKRKLTLKKGNIYVLYPSEFNDSTFHAERSFLETIKIVKTNLISYLIYSNPSYVGLTNYNYYLKKIKQINLDELKKWNRKTPSDRLIKTNINEDWAGHQTINPEEMSKILSNIKKVERNPKLDNDLQYTIQKKLNQYKFYIAKSALIEKLEEFDCFKRDKNISKVIIKDLKSLLKKLKIEFQLLGFTYFNNDNSIRNEDFEVKFFKIRKRSNFSIQKIDSDEIYLSKEKSNIEVLSNFKDYIKNL